MRQKVTLRATTRILFSDRRSAVPAGERFAVSVAEAARLIRAGSAVAVDQPARKGP